MSCIKCNPRHNNHPTTYDKRIPERMKTAMTRGVSLSRFCRDEKISLGNFYHWLKTQPELKEAYEDAKSNCEAYWEEWLIENFENKTINAPLVKMFFANRFGWTDKQESKVEATVKTHEDWVKILNQSPDVD